MVPIPVGDATVALQVVPGQFEEVVAVTITFALRLAGAIVILLIGWILGRAFGGLVTRIADRIEADRMVVATPIGRMLGGTERAVSQAFGTLARWFVYALAILAATDVLAIALLSEWITIAVSYLPAFVAGLFIIIFGFVVADFIGDAIMRTRAATQTEYTFWFANATRIFLYFTVLVIGLDTMGIDVGILFVFAEALAWGVAAAVALAVGIAFGWGAKDYIASNISTWAGRSPMAATDGGEGDDD